jgi:hypothetical protein
MRDAPAAVEDRYLERETRGLERLVQRLELRASGADATTVNQMQGKVRSLLNIVGTAHGAGSPSCLRPGNCDRCSLQARLRQASRQLTDLASAGRAPQRMGATRRPTSPPEGPSTSIRTVSGGLPTLGKRR